MGMTARSIRSRSLLLVALAVPVLAVPGWSQATAGTVTMASTTSTEQSGFFRYLLPLLERATGVRVRVVAVGTGQAIDICRRGDADLALTHDRQAEEQALAEGWFASRTEVMYNDFLLVGPAGDPAGVGGGRDVLAAFARLGSTRPPFVSRGDNSGTHAAELRFWAAAGVDLAAVRGSWYRETGSGMGPALNTASALAAYVLTDRATWISFRNRGPLVPLVEGDPRMFNQYAVLPVDQKRHPHVRADLASRVIAWLVSAEGQQAIAGFQLQGQQLYFPNGARRQVRGRPTAGGSPTVRRANLLTAGGSIPTLIGSESHGPRRSHEGNCTACHASVDGARFWRSGGVLVLVSGAGHRTLGGRLSPSRWRRRGSTRGGRSSRAGKTTGPRPART